MTRTWTPEDEVRLLELLRAQEAELCRRSLAEFIRHGWQVLEPGVALDWNWHIEFIAAHVQAVLEDWMRRQREPSYVQRARNVLFNVPPGTGKSRIVSVMAPAWMWLHWPSWRVMCLSTNPDVALRDADYSRQVIESEWYREWFRPEWKLRDDQDAKSNYGNTERGQRVSKGMRAKITGARYDCIIVDDPNDLKEIHSDKIREGVNHDWTTAIANRVNDLRSSVRIGIMQRGHERDWSGHVLSQGGWAHIPIPMELDPDQAEETFLGSRDPRTQPGEVLHPERFTPEVLETERSKGSYYYAGQFQQRPAPADGGIFKISWFRPVETLPDKFDEIVISVDCASKKTTDGSNTAIGAIARKGVWRYVLEVFAGHITTQDTARRIIAMKGRWGARRVLVEAKAAGPSVVEALKDGVPGVNGGKGIQGVMEVDVHAGDSKESRAMAVQHIVEAGDVMYVKGAPWVDAFLGEIASFPVGAKDDQVDMFTQALNYMREPDWRARFAV